MLSNLTIAYPNKGVMGDVKEATNLEAEELLRKVVLYQGQKTLPVVYLAQEEPQAEVILDVELDGFRYTLTRLPREIEVSDVTLSPREQEIVRLVTRGFSNKAIAAVLDISPWTVSTHLRRIFAKLGVNSRAETVTKVLKEGLLQKPVCT